MNSKIKAIKKTASVFRSFVNMGLRIMMCKNIKIRNKSISTPNAVE